LQKSKERERDREIERKRERERKKTIWRENKIVQKRQRVEG
jgi:hypothetical protein